MECRKMKFEPYTGDLISSIEEKCKKFEQVKCEIEHIFSDGIYSRIMKVPAGTFVIGKRHRFKTLNIMTKGKAIIHTGDNNKAKEISAPCTFVSEPLSRKMAFFIEDSEWMNVHPTEETDVDRIEELFIMPEEEYLLSVKGGVKCLG